MLSKTSAGLEGDCAIRSGTSIAVPVVTASLALVISAMRSPEYNMGDRVNPAL
mgnify:FL=1